MYQVIWSNHQGFFSVSNIYNKGCFEGYFLTDSSLSNFDVKYITIILYQFDEEPATQILSWLPRKLAPQVRCVVSMINDTAQHHTLMARETRPSELHLTPLNIHARQVLAATLAFGSDQYGSYIIQCIFL